MHKLTISIIPRFRLSQMLPQVPANLAPRVIGEMVTRVIEKVSTIKDEFIQIDGDRMQLKTDAPARDSEFDKSELEWLSKVLKSPEMPWTYLDYNAKTGWIDGMIQDISASLSA